VKLSSDNLRVADLGAKSGRQLDPMGLRQRSRGHATLSFPEPMGYEDAIPAHVLRNMAKTPTNRHYAISPSTTRCPSRLDACQDPDAAQQPLSPSLVLSRSCRSAKLASDPSALWSYKTSRDCTACHLVGAMPRQVGGGSIRAPLLTAVGTPATLASRSPLETSHEMSSLNRPLDE